MIVLSALGLAMMDAGTKYVSGVVSITVVLWVRYTIQSGMMGIWLWKTRGTAGFRTAHPRFQLLRGVLLLVVSALAILSLKFIPLAEFTAIAMLSPVMVTVISTRLLKQSLGRWRWIFLLCGFSGTLIMLRPGSGLFGVAALLPVLTTFTYAIYNVITSRIAPLENPYTSQFYTGITGCLLMLPVLFIQEGAVIGALNAMSPTNLAVLLGISLCGTISHLLIVMAFGRSNAAGLMPFVYVQIAFAAILGWLVFRYAPDFWSWVGMGVIAACGIGTAWLNVREAARAAGAAA